MGCVVLCLFWGFWVYLAVEVESICIISSRLCLVTIAALSSEGKIAAKCNRDVPVIVIVMTISSKRSKSE